jgi:hypothetical protein
MRIRKWPLEFFEKAFEKASGRPVRACVVKKKHQFRPQNQFRLGGCRKKHEKIFRES